MQLFAAYGTVVDCRLLASNVASGRSALVRLASPEEAAEAIKVGAVCLPLLAGHGAAQCTAIDRSDL